MSLTPGEWFILACLAWYALLALATAIIQRGDNPAR